MENSDIEDLCALIYFAEQPRVHYEVANLLQEYARHDLKLIGMSSAFMIHGVKSPP